LPWSEGEVARRAARECCETGRAFALAVLLIVTVMQSCSECMESESVHDQRVREFLVEQPLMPRFRHHEKFPLPASHSGSGVLAGNLGSNGASVFLTNRHELIARNDLYRIWTVRSAAVNLHHVTASQSSLARNRIRESPRFCGIPHVYIYIAQPYIRIVEKDQVVAD
jgi:hypothetical protein